MKNICIFCGSSIGSNKVYLKAAEELGAAIADQRMNLIYGGANVGLMGMVAKSCKENGGTVVGIMPEELVEMGVAKNDLDELHIVSSMHERKTLMSEMSDAFISMPGGIGTIEETFEIFTWMQLGLHSKPIGILNMNNFYHSLMEFLQKIVSEGFLRQEHLNMLIIESDVKSMLDRIKNYEHHHLEKWFDKDKNRID